MCLLVLEELGVLRDRSSTIEDGCFHLGHVLAETCILILNLICKLTGVAHNQDRCLASHRLNLLESSKDEDSGLTQTGFGLAEDVGTQDGLRDAHLLDCR